MQSLITRAINFVTVDIWRIRLEDLPFGKSFLIKQLRIFLLTVRGFDENKCFTRASSLTFYTLLSIVPVVAMLFGVAKGFGFEKLLEKELRELVVKLPGQEEVLTKVIEYAESLLESTKGGVIAGIGLVLLFWSVVKVLSHIEASLNDIWEIKESRTWGRKFSDYLAVMLISPMLILVSSSATVFVTAQITQLTQQIKLLGVLSPLIFLSFKLIPYVLIWILFTVIYVLMPNTKVNLKAGLVAGIIAGTIFQIVQWGYISFQVGTARYNAIYGSFAALPLFLMWVQISWWVVLFGAELSFANQNVGTYEYEPDSNKVSPAFKKVLTLQIAHLLIKNFASGQIPLTDTEISAQLRAPIRLVHNILFDLVESRLVSETTTRVDKKFGYQPARDINTLTITSVIDALEQNGTNSIPVVKNEEFEALSDAIQKFKDVMETSPANKLLKDI
ncbi:MAG: YihY/virulence factor BrkB family protein [Deltaproteobacteria bacterium]|nr:YihY/virulence factor BrkB family protein [Deltaproteobacteria bacterium]MBW2584283.1 YihY/virulence factor BrkB family protein [Deltaproteobacteria bacterium]